MDEAVNIFRCVSVFVCYLNYQYLFDARRTSCPTDIEQIVEHSLSELGAVATRLVLNALYTKLRKPWNRVVEMGLPIWDEVPEGAQRGVLEPYTFSACRLLLCGESSSL